MVNSLGDLFWKRVDVISKMSLRELADKTGLVYGTIKNQRAMRTLPKKGAIYKIAEALNVSDEYLVYGYSPYDDFGENFWKGVSSKCVEKEIGKLRLYSETGMNPELDMSWEKEGKLPPMDMILRFAAYLDVDVYWLMYGDRIPNAQAMRESMDKEYNLTLEGALEEIESLKKELAQLKGSSDN